MDRLPRIPLADIVDRFVDWLTMTFGGFFDGISNGLAAFVNAIVSGLGFIPSILLTVIFAPRLVDQYERNCTLYVNRIPCY